MAKAKITGVLKVGLNKFMVVSNRGIFPYGSTWDVGSSDNDVGLIYATDELDAWKIGSEIADEWNKRNKTQRQTVRGKASSD